MVDAARQNVLDIETLFISFLLVSFVGVVKRSLSPNEVHHMAQHPRLGWLRLQLWRAW